MRIADVEPGQLYRWIYDGRGDGKPVRAVSTDAQTPTGRQVRCTLVTRGGDVDYAGSRDPDASATIPARELELWQTHWDINGERVLASEAADAVVDDMLVALTEAGIDARVHTSERSPDITIRLRPAVARALIERLQVPAVG